MSLNANSPTVVGLEWFPYRQRGLRIGKDQQWAARWTPGVVTGDDLALFMASTSGAPVINVEIVPEASVVPGVTVTSTYRPNNDGSVTGVTHNGGGAVAPFYVDVDEVVLDSTDYNILQTTSGYALFEYAAAGFTGRPVAVTLHVDVEALAGGTTVIIPRISIGGVVYDGPSSSIAVGRLTAPAEYTYTWKYNPATGAAWTAAAIAAIDSGSYVGLDNASSTTNLVRAYQEWITVDAAATDARVAVGSFTAVDGWNVVSMLSPAAADTWGLSAATSYLVVLSNPQGTGTTSWRALDAGVAHPDVSAASVTFDTRGVPSALGATDTAAPAFAVLNGVGVALTGQGYVSIIEEAIYTGRVVQQEVTLPDTASRGSIKSVARQQSSATTASLLAKLKRRSDDVQVGGTVTVNPFDVRGEPQFPQSTWLPGASGAAGTNAQHYVEFTSTAASGNGWLLTTLSTADVATEKLTTNQQGVETDTTGFAAGASTAMVRSTTQKRTGAASLELHWNAGASGTASASTLTGVSGFVVAVGAVYTVSVWARDGGAIHKTYELRINFYDSGGTIIGSSNLLASLTSTAVFQQLTGAMVAPATAAFGAVVVNVLASNGSDVNYFDDFSALENGLYGILSAGGNTDQATIAGVKAIGRDVPVLVGTTRTAPGSQTVTQT